MAPVNPLVLNFAKLLIVYSMEVLLDYTAPFKWSPTVYCSIIGIRAITF